MYSKFDEFIYKTNSFFLTMFLRFIIRYRYSQLFVMAIRTPTGKTFPGNYTIIPSSKKWVFHSIFRLAFFSLYGEHVCSMNRLVLTDEEDAEYCAFESVIATHDAFSSSKVMLCTFHAVDNPLNGMYIICCHQRNLPKGS